MHGGMTRILRARLDCCAAIYCARRNVYYDARVMVCGGNPVGAPHTEAYAMKRSLMERGVPSSAISAEARSLRTHENLRNMLIILRRGTICLITSTWHIARVQQLQQLQQL